MKIPVCNASFIILFLFVVFDYAPAQRLPKGLFDIQRNSVSQVDFFTSNYGQFGYSTTGRGGLFYPRGSTNLYGYGAGIWFGAKKRVNGAMNKLYEFGYNPNSGASWLTPFRYAGTTDSAITRVYFSTDYTTDGTPKHSVDGPNWPIWQPQGKIAGSVGYGGDYVDNPTERIAQIFSGGAVMMSDEDIVCSYTDNDLMRYEGGEETRKKQGYPLGLRFDDRIYSFGSGELERVVIFRKHITNTSRDTLFECAVSTMFDFDVLDILDTIRVSWKESRNDFSRYFYEDPSLQLGFAYTALDQGEAGKNFGYIGITFTETPSANDSKLLVENTHNDKSKQLGVTSFIAANIDGEPDIIYEDRYAAISSTIIDSFSREKNDIRVWVSTGTFTLLPDQSVTLGYALLFAPSATGRYDGSTEDCTALAALCKTVHRQYDSLFFSASGKVKANNSIPSGAYIFPSPATNGLFTVSAPELAHQTSSYVKVYDILGCCLYSAVATVSAGGTIQLNLSFLASGQYRCVVTTANGISLTAPFMLIW